MFPRSFTKGTGSRGGAPALSAVIGILVVLWAILYIPALGSSGLWDPWEPRYAQSPREMADRGDWIVPHYRGDARLVKPPMTYWLIGTSQSLLGITERAARTPSSILALLAPLALAWALWRREMALEGLLAGAALLTGPQWLLSGRFATPDMPFASFTGLALAFAVTAPDSKGTPRRGWVLAAGGAVALATLTEWPRGLLLPLWAVVAWGACLGRRRWIGLLAVCSGLYLAGQQLVRGDLNLGAVALLLIGAVWILRGEARIPWSTLLMLAGLIALLVAPWFVAVFNAEPAEAAERLLGYKHGLNLGESPGQHDGPWFYSLVIVLVGALPWCAAAPAGALACGDAGVRRLLCGAALGGLIFFTLAEAKMGHFHLVLQAPLAGLAGCGIVAAMRRDRREIWIVTACLAATAALVLWQETLILDSAHVKRGLHGLVRLMPAACATLGVTALLLWVGRLRESWPIRLAVIVAPLALSAFLVFAVVPTLGPTKSLGPIWAAMQAEEPAAPVAMYGSGKDSAYYYSDNGVLRLRKERQLREFTARPGPKFAVMSRRTYERIDAELRERWEVVPDVGHRSYLLLRSR